MEVAVTGQEGAVGAGRDDLGLAAELLVQDGKMQAAALMLDVRSWHYGEYWNDGCPLTLEVDHYLIDRFTDLSLPAPLDRGSRWARSSHQGVQLSRERMRARLWDDTPVRIGIERECCWASWRKCRTQNAAASETTFTNALDPEPASRRVFSFHRPETLADTLDRLGDVARGIRDATLRMRLLRLPPLDPKGIWSAQETAIRNTEESLRSFKPRALIQMATGSGKTFTSANLSYRLVKFADARRILFLVDRANSTVNVDYRSVFVHS